MLVCFKREKIIWGRTGDLLNAGDSCSPIFLRSLSLPVLSSQLCSSGMFSLCSDRSLQGFSSSSSRCSHPAAHFLAGCWLKEGEMPKGLPAAAGVQQSSHTLSHFQGCYQSSGTRTMPWCPGWDRESSSGSHSALGSSWCREQITPSPPCTDSVCSAWERGISAEEKGDLSPAGCLNKTCCETVNTWTAPSGIWAPALEGS